MNQRITGLFLATALLAATSIAQAQWVWVNDKGVKQLSDQPPPPGTPANRILKAPRGAALPDLRKEMAEASANGGDTPAAEAKPAPKAPPTLAERNADYKKRQKEAADNEAKAAAEAQHASEKTKYCAEAKNNIAMMESGMRISEMGPNGERNFMSDESRAQKLQENRNAYNKTCK